MISLYFIAVLSFFVIYMSGDLLMRYIESRERAKSIHGKIAEFGGAYKGDYQGIVKEAQVFYGQNRESIFIYGYVFIAFLISVFAGNHFENDSPLLLSLALFFLAVGALYMALKTRREGHRKKIVQYFPEFIDLLILCVQAGMTAEDAMMRISKQKDLVPEAFCDEIERLLSEMRFSARKQQAFEELASRLKDPFIDLFVQTMIHSQNQGTPILASLKNIIHDYRQEKLLKLEEKASKMPVLMTFPLILFILPTIFIVILGPSILRLLDVLSAQNF